MLINQSIITDIKAIIVQERDNAVRTVDHQRTLMYWHIGKRIFEYWPVADVRQLLRPYWKAAT